MITIILITIITFLANIVGVLSGFGVGTIMTPILLLLLPFPQTIFLIAIIHWFHDIWKAYFFKHGIDWKLFLGFGIPSILASSLGSLLVVANPDLLLFFLGIFLVAYSCLLLLYPHFEVPSNRYNTILGGSISGFTAGLFGIRGAIRSAFLAAYKLPKATFLGTTGVISLLLDTTRLLVYWFEGISFETYIVNSIVIFIAASLIGSYVGQFLVKRVVPHDYFRKIVLVFLFVFGLYFVISHLF